jgi:hypothetical protein
MESLQNMFRYHAFGQNVLYHKMKKEFVFKYLNEQGKRIPHLMCWRRYRGKSIPFVRTGKTYELRDLLILNIPEAKKWVPDNYLFLD